MIPTLSVIVPIYNVEKYLNRCVDSLICQITDEIEIILVDDGSPDNCGKICDEYAKAYPQIKVIHKENGGLVSARKAGTVEAKGEYIASLDGDDWYDDNFFKKILEIIKKYSPDIIRFDWRNVYEDKIIEKHVGLKSGLYTKEDIERDIFPILIEDENSLYYDTSIVDAVVNRELYVPVQLNISDDVDIGEDAVCTKPIICGANSMYVMNDILYNYRINTNSMTKGHKPFDLYYPMRVGQSFEENIDAEKFDFQAQIYRYVAHNLFNACSSQFYYNKPYKEIINDIKSCLKEPYYRKTIKNCKFGRKNYKGRISLLALKYKCFFLMKLYCKSKFKSW
ncbi:MAG: glycosyltransferase family 2 protein [Clostridia bacterium]|nr:glycosyltransferase family 2 protein [Clostridia bacterium]